MKLFCISFLLLTVLFSLSSCFNLCANKTDYSIQSPDGNFIVHVYERDCGATTDFSTQISILKSNKKLKNENGNIFIATGGKASLSTPGTISTEIIWENDNSIIIRYDGKAEVFKSVKSLNGIKIQYETF